MQYVEAMDNILYTCLEIHLQRKSERALKIPGKKKYLLKNSHQEDSTKDKLASVKTQWPNGYFVLALVRDACKEARKGFCVYLRTGTQKNALCLSVNVFSTKVLITGIMF